MFVQAGDPASGFYLVQSNQVDAAVVLSERVQVVGVFAKDLNHAVDICPGGRGSPVDRNSVTQVDQPLRHVRFHIGDQAFHLAFTHRDGQVFFGHDRPCEFNIFFKSLNRKRTAVDSVDIKWLDGDSFFGQQCGHHVTHFFGQGCCVVTQMQQCSSVHGQRA